MSKILKSSLYALTLLLVYPANASPLIVQADSFESFTRLFCSVSHNAEHIFVVPTSVFTENSEIGCEGKTSMLRMSEPQDDPGHTVFNIDPPSGETKGLDCDGKADTGMAIVAINCIPADMEEADHKKT